MRSFLPHYKPIGCFIVNGTKARESPMETLKTDNSVTKLTMFSAQTRVRIKRADNQLSNPIKIELLPECYRKTDETTLTICIDHRR